MLRARYGGAVGDIWIKNVPEDVHVELRRRVEREGLTIRDYVLELIRRNQEFPPRSEWLESLGELERVELGRPAAELIREQRATRSDPGLT